MPHQSHLPRALFACLCIAGSAQAATLVNPGLESSSLEFIEGVSAGASANGWTAVGANIEFVKTGYSNGSDTVGAAQEGDWFVDLNGTQGPAGIGQDVATDAGQQYRIDFWMSANAGPNGSTSADGSKSMDVLWNNAVVGSFTFVHQPGDGWSNLRWEGHSVLVTGTGNLASLELRSTSSFYAAAGPFVDAIAITAVPEPGTWAMFGAGLGVLALSAQRRRAR